MSLLWWPQGPRKPVPQGRQRRCRPALEPLEERAVPAAGDLDLSFSGDGKQNVGFDLGGQKGEVAWAVALDAQGRATFTPTAPGRFTLEDTATDADGYVGTAQSVLKVRDPADAAAPDARLDQRYSYVRALVASVATRRCTASNAPLASGSAIMSNKQRPTTASGVGLSGPRLGANPLQPSRPTAITAPSRATR